MMSKQLTGTTLAAAVAAALALPGAAVAQRDVERHTPAATLAPANPLAVPPVQTSNGVRYMNGGVGVGERDAMRGAGRDFGLHLSFSEATSGHYVAGVDLSIADAHGGTVFTLPNAGPWVYVDLPPGSYRVTADYQGRTQTQRVSVGDGGPAATAYLRWQAPVGGTAGWAWHGS
jgi:hypothetical protein